MNDMRGAIEPKSDQKNADDLLAGPLTITITSVEIRPGTEQPVTVHYDGENGRPYKPCKSMCRVMVHGWGADARNYVGRSMTLYCDPTVKWGGMAVGGIRISHMSDLKGKLEMALTTTKGQRKPCIVLPLVIEKRKTVADHKAEIDALDLAGVTDWLADNARFNDETKPSLYAIWQHAVERGRLLTAEPQNDEAI